MRTLLAAFLCFMAFGEPALAQLTGPQKLNDFHQVEALFAKRYAFLEWKRDALQYDGTALAPWLDLAGKAASDVDLFAICSKYIAGFQDGHSTFLLQSDFEATLGFTVDIYEGKFLIDSIDRKTLPADQFPFQVGDELISIDGIAASQATQDLAQFVGEGNPRSAQRLAAGFLTDRIQEILPRAHEIGEAASVVIQGPAGARQFSMPWKKTGLPYTTVGPVPDTAARNKVPSRKAAAARTASSALPQYMSSLDRLQNFTWTASKYSLAVDQVKPPFDLPAGFVQRLGTKQFDSLFTGSFTAGGKQIGYLRAANFESIYSSQVATEVAFFQANTDGLIIDMMRNPGGYGCSAEGLASFLIPGGFHSLGNSLRATWDWVESFRQDVEIAPLYGATPDQIAALQSFLQSVEDAYAEPRGFTYPLPICGYHKDVPEAQDKNGKPLAYTKPIMVLTDELSASAAELFAAIMQDNQRALIYGMRTAGAGGAVNVYPVGFYMEAYASLPQSILVRVHNSTLQGLPDAPYIENFGVAPDKIDDYMTTDNLMNRGKSFVSGFTQAMLDYINVRTGGK